MKKVRLLLSISIILMSLLVLSCGQHYGTDNIFYKGNKVENRIECVKEIKDVLPSNIKLGTRYRVLVLADVHVGSPIKETDIKPLLKWLNEYKKSNPSLYPVFGLSLGDLVDHGTMAEYEKYVALMNKIEDKGIHIVNVLGNHDLYNSGWDNYKKMCYPYCSLFKFETNKFAWYAVDTGTGDLSIKQYRILKDAFAKDSKPKIVMMHYPIANSKQFGTFCMHDTTERNLLIDLFAKNNVKAALCGHLHQKQAMNLQAFQEYGNPSLCYSENGWTLFEIDESNDSVTKIDINAAF